MRRRPASSTALEASRTTVLKYRIGGRRKCRQSGAALPRTTMALVSAANVMEIVAIAIHTPVSAGLSGTSATRGGAAAPGGGGGSGGGEATVVTARPSMHARRCGRGLHEIVRPAGAAPDTVLVGPPLHHGRASPEVVEG